MSLADETAALHLDTRTNLFSLASFKKGDEMGHFRHGSTIIAFATNSIWFAI